MIIIIIILIIIIMIIIIMKLLTLFHFGCFICGLEEKNSKSEVIFAVCRLQLTSYLTSLILTATTNDNDNAFHKHIF